MWIEYNPNPVGRSVGDCAVRAISKALDVSWETAYLILLSNGYSMGDMPSSDGVIGATLRKEGFRKKAIPNDCPDCYTIKDFAESHPNGTYVVGTGAHVVCIKNGDVYDSWDSSYELPIYYWYRKDD